MLLTLTVSAPQTFGAVRRSTLYHRARFVAASKPETPHGLKPAARWRRMMATVIQRSATLSNDIARAIRRQARFGRNKDCACVPQSALGWRPTCASPQGLCVHDAIGSGRAELGRSETIAAAPTGLKCSGLII